ncbi:hypothetical protein ACFUOZ_09025 [Paenarthrobacter sp. NPDC057355]
MATHQQPERAWLKLPPAVVYDKDVDMAEGLRQLIEVLLAPTHPTE